MIDHLALRCTDPEPYLARLIEAGLAFERRCVPQIGMDLIFVRDPNDVLVELGFAMAAEGGEDSARPPAVR